MKPWPASGPMVGDVDNVLRNALSRDCVKRTQCSVWAFGPGHVNHTGRSARAIAAWPFIIVVIAVAVAAWSLTLLLFWMYVCFVFVWGVLEIWDMQIRRPLLFYPLWQVEKKRVSDLRAPQARR